MLYQDRDTSKQLSYNGVASGRACRAQHDLKYPDRKYQSPFKVNCQPYPKTYVRENTLFFVVLKFERRPSIVLPIKYLSSLPYVKSKHRAMRDVFSRFMRFCHWTLCGRSYENDLLIVIVIVVAVLW